MSELNNIPKHWQVKKLGEVCQTTSGGTPSRGNKSYYEGNIPWVKSGELDRGLILDTEEKISEEAVKNSSAKVFPKGTLLIALYGATIGKLAFLGVDAATNQAVCGIYKNENINSNYLYHFLFSKKPSLVKQGIGGAQPNISQGILKNLDIPIPPLPEQLAIVSKIEELLSDLENGKQQLLTAQQQLKVYRQSLLKAAFEGKLTSTSLNEQGSSSEAETKEGELPEGWRIVELSEVADMCLGKMLDKSKNKGNYQYYLRNISVRWGSFDLDDLEQMRFEESESERFGLKKGDLVICEGGEPGRCAIWNIENSGIKIQKALHRVRVSYKLNVKFLFYYIYYSGMTGLLEKYFTGTTIKHLTGSGLKKVRIPLPHISEQQKVVDELESKLTVCDKIEETISQSLLQAETLKQSILKKAFEGKL